MTNNHKPRALNCAKVMADKSVQVMAGNGRFYDPFNLTCEDFSDLEPIAKALSRIHRFWGQTDLSVARHCVNVAFALEMMEEPVETVLWGLLHETAEAFLGDLPTPIKDAMPQYRELENSILKRMSECLDLPYPMPKIVKEVDRLMMYMEAICLMPKERMDYWFEKAINDETISGFIDRSGSMDMSRIGGSLVIFARCLRDSKTKNIPLENLYIPIAEFKGGITGKTFESRSFIPYARSLLDTLARQLAWQRAKANTDCPF